MGNSIRTFQGIEAASGARAKVFVPCADVHDRKEEIALDRGTLLSLCLRTQDEERRKLAHSLNDSAVQYLIALQMKLEALQRSSIASTGRKNTVVDECRELVRRCHREIRATSYVLYPALLDDLGLEPALHLHVNGFMERTRIKVELDVEPNLGRLDRDLEIALFRMVQEGLAIVCGQRAVSDIHIKIGAAGTTLFVEVSGHGGGEAPAVHTAHRGLALAMTMLQQRIVEMDGLFEIGSHADGITIRAAVPRRALIAQACD
jgi:two-component system, NarL family, sensor kinase